MKISIIIPVFNAVNTIRRAIASVDTKQNYEIICINDGSVDDSKFVLEQLQKEYKNIIIIKESDLFRKTINYFTVYLFSHLILIL